MIFLVLAVFSNAFVNIGLAQAARRQYPIRQLLCFNYLTAALLAGMALALQRPTLYPVQFRLFLQALTGRAASGTGTSFAVFFGALTGVFYVVTILAVHAGVRSCGAGVTTMYQRLGILVPILCSALLWGEIPSPLQLAGLVMAILVMVGQRGHASQGTSRLPFLVFLLGGIVEFTGKLFQKSAPETDRPLFLFVVFLTCLVLVLCFGSHPAEKFSSGAALVGVLTGVPNLLSPFFTMKALEVLSPGIVYPTISVGSIAVVTAADAWVFHRSLCRREKITLALIALCLVLVNL